MNHAVRNVDTSGSAVQKVSGPLGLTRFVFTPILPKVKERKDKLNSYDRYMEWRDNSPKRHRKAGVR